MDEETNNLIASLCKKPLAEIKDGLNGLSDIDALKLAAILTLRLDELKKRSKNTSEGVTHENP